MLILCNIFLQQLNNFSLLKMADVRHFCRAEMRILSLEGGRGSGEIRVTQWLNQWALCHSAPKPAFRPYWPILAIALHTLTQRNAIRRRAMLLLSDLVLSYVDGPIRNGSSLSLKGLSQWNCDVSLIDRKMLRIGWPKMVAVRRQ